MTVSRRHFLSGVAVWGLAGHGRTSLQAAAKDRRKAGRSKACILMWMKGGPPAGALWDVKERSPFRPIETTVPGISICEHLPRTARIMDELSLIRSMSTREADIHRARYFMHTAFVPNPTVVHPTFGSVVSYELKPTRESLEIPSFVAVGGSPGSSGYLGAEHDALIVDASGRVPNLPEVSPDEERLQRRLQMLRTIEVGFSESRRGSIPRTHQTQLRRAVHLMTSAQRRAFRIEDEPLATFESYGDNEFGRSLVLARRLVETGVSFVEVHFPLSWDVRKNARQILRHRHLPMLDLGVSGLVTDLKQRGMLDDVVIVWMGAHSRVNRYGAESSGIPWAAAWTNVIGGGGMNHGQAVGSTDQYGLSCTSQSYLPGDIWATVCHALGIPATRRHRSRRGRPLRIANGGTPIKDLTV